LKSYKLLFTPRSITATMSAHDTANTYFNNYLEYLHTLKDDPAKAEAAFAEGLAYQRFLK
jgi:hypothetical protein